MPDFYLILTLVIFAVCFVILGVSFRREGKASFKNMLMYFSDFFMLIAILLLTIAMFYAVVIYG